MSDKKSRLLSEELKREIIRLAREGYPQLKIMEMLNVSQYAVTHYAKGINPQKKISDEQKSEVIMLLQETEYPAKRIAEIVGVSSRCVTRINRMTQIRPSKRGRYRDEYRQTPERDHSLRYEVFVFNWVESPATVNNVVFDHVPCYWDLMRVCAEISMPAEDFETEATSNLRDKVCYGTVYDDKGRSVAKYSIERIIGDETDYDDFWDGMDKNFYDN